MRLSPSAIEREFNRFCPVPVDDLVRIGRACDGGYVVSLRTVANADLLIGLGINDDWSFESDYLNRFPDAHLVAVDGSVSTGFFRRRAILDGVDAVRYAMRGQLSNARQALESTRRNGQVSSEFRKFFSHPNRRFVKEMLSQGGIGGFCWSDLIRIVESDVPMPTRYFVKMDIEGAEFRVLPELLPYADRISGLAIEFHNCDLLWERLMEIIDQLSEAFVIVHTHGNNWGGLIKGTGVPEVLELSLAHRSLVTPEELERINDRQYPLPILDAPNRQEKPDHPLRFGGR